MKRWDFFRELNVTLDFRGQFVGYLVLKIAESYEEKANKQFTEANI